MLHHVGLNSAAELFDSIPEDLRLARNLGAQRTSFLGGRRITQNKPTIVDHIISRSEFFTAYTPYQPEISQGTLQTIFEFQTLVCQLTGMEVANASMYDGSTALAEAVLMAERVTRRSKVLAASSVHPQYLEVVKTYVQHAGIELQMADFDEQTGQIASTFAASLDDQTAAIVIQSPNFFGCVEDIGFLAAAAHAKGALLVVAITEAISLGLLKSPGACNADIVVAEGQSFGVPLSFGGPYVGLFAVREKYARQIPGRLVGEAYDQEGRRGFVLTLATREQHIRREKATSNICTNEGLIALAATVYLETMGRRGIQEVAMQCAQKTAYAAKRISKLEGFSVPFTGPRFNEFVVHAPVAAKELLSRLASERNVTGGLALSRYYSDRPNEFLVCVTEMNSRAQIDALVEGIESTARPL